MELTKQKISPVLTALYIRCEHFRFNKQHIISANATEVVFHVTVMSLDTIDESSMVSKFMQGARPKSMILQRALLPKNCHGPEKTTSHKNHFQVATHTQIAKFPLEF